jgi:hypothetical protein
MKHKRLTQSVLISAALHLAAAAVLFSKQLYIAPHFLTLMGKMPSVFLEEEEISLLKRNEALASALSQFEVPQSTSKKMAKLKMESIPTVSQVALSFPSTEPNLELHAWSPTIEEGSLPLLKPYSLNLSVMEASKGVAVSLGSPLDYLESLPSSLRAEDIAAAHPFTSEEVASISLPFQQVVPQNFEPSLATSITFNEKTPFPIHPDFTITPETQSSITHMRQSFSFQEYGLPALYLNEWNEFFEVDVKVFPHEEKGFLFSVHLIPKQDLSEHRLKQNYLFVIDRTNLTDKNLYQGFKKAVSRAICALREGDYFNVILLDASVKALDEKPLKFTKANQKLAEEFLNKNSRSHHHGADLYTQLSQIIKFGDDSHEAMTAILISDGGPHLKQHVQRRKINQWLEANRDRLTIYTATAGLGQNLSSLKMIGSASRGSLLYSDTHASFPRKLAKLVMDLRYPIGKEMTASLVSHDLSARVEFLPPSSRLPYLFSDHPFVFVGSCDKLSDFTLIVEGKNRNQDLIIKKTISLSKAKPASRLLVKQWSAEKTNTLLDQYLREGEISILKQAEKELGYDLKNPRR